MAPYAGTTIRLVFQVHDDGFGDPTWMNVDDVYITQNTFIYSTANISDAALSSTGGFNITAVEGQPSGTQTVATFTDADPGEGPGEVPGDYTAVINWGDSTTSPGTITGPVAGVFTVTGAHTYKEEGGFFPTVTITDNLATTTATDTADVTDAPLTAVPTTLVSTEGAQFSGSIGGFTDADTYDDNSSVADYTVSIDWGDGTAADTTSGVVTGSGGTFNVTGVHTYAEEGPYTVRATVNDIGHSSTVITSTMTTSDAALTNTPGSAIVVNEGTALSAVSLGGFHDADPGEGPGETPTDYSVTINWGDGTPADTTSGVISGSGQDFTVTGNHTYAEENGATSIVATVTDTNGTTTAITTPVTVNDAPLNALGGITNSGTEGTALSTISVASFSDTDAGEVPGETPNDFSATIDWGDGTALDSSTTIIAGDLPGQYVVQGSHTYAEEGTYVPTVVFEDTVGGNTATVSTGTDITVADALLSATAINLTGAEGTAIPAGTALSTFTDADPGEVAHETAGDYSATIDWGDGTTGDPVTITGPTSGGVYTVKNANPHTYAEGLNSYNLAVVVTDVAGGNTATANPTANISDYAISAAPISSTGNPIQALEGQAFSGPVATFTDSDPASEGAGHYQATIDWGDSSTSAGVISGSGSSYTVSGTHTWLEEVIHQLPISVTITDIGGAVVTPSPVVSHVFIDDAPLTSTVTVVHAVEGALFSGTVSTIQDTNPNGTADDFTAQITWGDGHSGSGVITGPVGGPFTVSGTNTYAEETATASPAIGEVVVQISDIGGRSTATHALPVVADAPIAVTGLTNGLAVGGTALTSYPVATFTDGDPTAGESLADITTSINWGDSTSSAGTITGPVAGVYTVVGTHTYAEENAGRTVVATVTDAGGSTGSAGRTIVVGDAPLTGAIATLPTVTEGSALSSIPVATFADANPQVDVNDFTATITWGDGGPTSAGTITSNGGGNYTVTSSHTYAEEGSKALSVLITDVGGQIVTPSTTLSVLDAALNATATALNGVEGAALSGVQVATFTDADPAGTATDYTASIDWGDGGSPTAGIVSLVSGSLFKVVGTHTYAEEGGPTPTVTITDHNAQAIVHPTATITDAALTVTGLTSAISATEGTAIPSTLLASFTDADPAGTATDYTATINWGDGGPTSVGTISQCVSADNCTGGTSAFKVVGAHTYADEGAGKVVTVTVNDAVATASSNSTTVNVADAALSSVAAATAVTGEASPSVFNKVLATWSDGNPAATVGDFTFRVTDWGDSTAGTTTGTVATSGAGFAGSAAHTYANPGNYAVVWTVTDDGGRTGGGTTNVSIAFPPGPYVPLTPFRILDTRTSSGHPQAGSHVHSQESRNVSILNVSGSGLPTSGVQAVVLNVTAVNPTADTFLTVFPTGSAGVPTASNLNLPAGTVKPNLVEVALGTGGQVTVFNNAGQTDVIMDLEGYVSQAPNGTHGLYNSLAPSRIYDTRNDANNNHPGKGLSLTPNSTRSINIAGQGGIPATGVGAAILNFTVTNESGAVGGFLTVFPHGATRPDASNLNFVDNVTVANRVIVPVVNGQIDVYNFSGTNQMLIDVSGWFTDGSDSTATGALFKGLQQPFRLCDTRDGLSPACPVVGKLIEGQSIVLQVAGNGIPAIGANESPVAVVLNVTGVNTTGFGYFTVYPANVNTVPGSSDVNWSGPTNLGVPNLVVAKLSPDGKITVNNALGQAHLIVDIFGWYS
jgi:hypothetical protein